MDIFLQKDKAFVDLGNGYMLCIGTKAEVDQADATRIGEMIKEAVVYAQWRSIVSSRSMTLH